METPYLESYRRCLSLYADEDFTHVPRPILENFIIALAKRVTPVAARRLYDRQRETTDVYKILLLGLLDDFGDDLESAIAEEPNLEERKRGARERVDAFAFWMVMAAWEWFHYGFALGKLSIHFSRGDLLTVAWAWHQNLMFVYQRLAPDLIAALIEAIEKGEDVAPVLNKFRWRVGMYAGAMWGVIQKAALYRPPPDERVKAEEPWAPPISWWTFPAPVAVFPLLWEAPPEWGAPEEPAADTPAWEIAQRQVYWHGQLTETTCVGERGCWGRIGNIYYVAMLQIKNFFPGVMACLSNCRCSLTPIGESGEISTDPKDYAWPF